MYVQYIYSIGSRFEKINSASDTHIGIRNKQWYSVYVVQCRFSKRGGGGYLPALPYPQILIPPLSIKTLHRIVVQLYKHSICSTVMCGCTFYWLILYINFIVCFCSGDAEYSRQFPPTGPLPRQALSNKGANFWFIAIVFKKLKNKSLFCLAPNNCFISPVGEFLIWCREHKNFFLSVLWI